MTTSNREEFEAWYTKKGWSDITGFSAPLTKRRNEAETYSHDAPRVMWTTWQAATAQSAARIKELEEDVATLEAEVSELRSRYK